MKYVVVGYWYDDEMNRDEKGCISFEDEFQTLDEAVNGAINAVNNIDYGCADKRDVTIECWKDEEELEQEIWVHDGRDGDSYETFTKFKTSFKH